MSTHPYIRAYMAGVTLPSLAVLFLLVVFSVAHFGYHVPLAIERVIVFPVAVIPFLFGMWNVLYVALGPERRWPLGAHGALLPFVLAPLGLLLGLSLDVAELTPNGIYYFHYVTLPYSTIALVFPLPVIIYYLVWKYLIGFLNRLLGIG